MHHNSFEYHNANGRKFALIKSRFNPEITNGLLNGAQRALHDSHVLKTDIAVFEVPGGFEIPLAVKRALEEKKYDAVITLGCVMKGQTQHHQVIMDAIAPPLVQLALDYSTPVTLGIIIPETQEQAQARSGNDNNNAGYGAAMAAVEMVLLT